MKIRNFNDLKHLKPIKHLKHLKHLIHLKHWNYLKNEEGSAVVEFVILALPLFIPLAIFLTTVSRESTVQSDARNYARQFARVYATSPTQDLIPARIEELNSAFSSSVFARDKIEIPPKVTVECSLNPCLSPKSLLLVTVEIQSIDHQVRALAKVSQSVDAWRSS